MHIVIVDTEATRAEAQALRELVTKELPAATIHADRGGFCVGSWRWWW
jgi:hypothetical protein